MLWLPRQLLKTERPLTCFRNQNRGDTGTHHRSVIHIRHPFQNKIQPSAAQMFAQTFLKSLTILFISTTFQMNHTTAVKLGEEEVKARQPLYGAVEEISSVDNTLLPQPRSEYFEMQMMLLGGTAFILYVAYWIFYLLAIKSLTVISDIDVLF